MINHIQYHVWYHSWYHRQNHDIIYDIIAYPFLARMILYQKVWYHTWYHIWYWKNCDIILNIISNIIADPFLALFSYDIIYDVIYISYDFVHDVIITWNHNWYCLWFVPLISLLREFIAIRYHIFCDISAHVMVPARRAGAGCGRQAPGAPPAPATPSPICWGRVFNWTVTALMPCMDLLHWLLRA